MLKYLSLALAALALSGCQPPAPESVLATQKPPSAAVRKEYVAVMRAIDAKGAQFKMAEISSVVLLNPEAKIYAFCVRFRETRIQEVLQVGGYALRDGKIVDSSSYDSRCSDKRLRWYDFPELRSMRS
ncbi:hypothetical protein [Sinorhizobium sp. NFACC03]|jgi:hypothetical protein|uniref:hypothetical protein n=1 Tax=Sinorhizobium/Ensifer group TaxID=227292 RepID=UPI0008870E3C|nr:hypothetical protein [Sinorhizobium sp. NFACC03]SDA64762.1 hypothetical protein SAMN03159448_01975 [Sinorhizobium sp. NFACC03]